MENKQCPVCSKPMNYNADGLKRNPKAPHWKCSDSACKFQYDKGQGKYIPSDYITSEWDNSIQNKQSIVSAPSQPLEQPVSPSYTPTNERPSKENTYNQEKPVDETQQHIRWCNALNNSCLLMSNKPNDIGIDVKGWIEDMANWIYKLEPKEDGYGEPSIDPKDITGNEPWNKPMGNNGEEIIDRTDQAELRSEDINIPF